MAKKYTGATVFDKAYAALEDRGWCQGDYEALDGKVCLVGALNVGLGFDADPGEYRLDGNKTDKRRIEAVNILSSVITKGESDKWVVSHDWDEVDYETTFPSSESLMETREASVTSWNDTSGWYGGAKRKPSEVKKMLKRAAKMAATSGNRLLTYP
jgi:uncharacterized membrane protein